jgi:hypothetical protein
MTTSSERTLPILDLRRFWYRTHERAVARVRRASGTYESASQSGQPAWNEWERLRAAKRRTAYCCWQLCRVMGW